MSRLSGVRFAVEPVRRKNVPGGALDIDRIVVNGKTVGTVEHLSKGGHVSSRTCTFRRKTCKKGRDLIWLFEAGGLMGARVRKIRKG